MLWLCSFAVVFHLLEGWTLYESFYFCWTTVTTIGFGDLYPEGEGTTVLVTFMILIGWGFTAFTIASIGALFSDIEQRSHDALLRLKSQFANQTWIESGFGSMLPGTSLATGAGDDAADGGGLAVERDSSADGMSASRLGKTLEFAAVKHSVSKANRK